MNKLLLVNASSDMTGHPILYMEFLIVATGNTERSEA
jgi:hypothetical protein